MTWQQFILSLESLEPMAVEDALLELGAASVTYSDAADDPVLEPGVVCGIAVGYRCGAEL